jgi:hypothetical protein
VTTNIATTTWLLGGSVSLFLYLLGVTLKSWRETKRSPYFFQRRQAELRMEQYGLATFMLACITGVVAYLAWNPAADNVTRMALLEGAKPVQVALVEQQADGSLETAGPVSLDIQASPAISASSAQVTDSVAADLSAPGIDTFAVRDVSVPQELPAQYRQQYEATVELSEDTQLGSIAFSTDVDDRYQAVNPGRIFDAGFFTLYATFDYAGMGNGMEWAWIWRYDGQVIDGGTQEWTYGEDGPGYVYFDPEEGFQPGEYSLQIWVNEEMMTQANIIVTSVASR